MIDQAAPHHGVHCSGLVRIYQTSEIEVVALQSLDFDVEPGELVTIVGASGSGKSTLLQILGGLDQPTAGQAYVAGYDLNAMDDADRTRFRREVIGFVWQQTSKNLLGYLDAQANVEFPMSLAGVDRADRRERSAWLLELVGLGDRRDHRPAELSGGEQQRVAIAVALANEPAVLLADEPTGELDSTTAGEVVDLLHEVNRELGITGVIVTHDPLVSDHVDRTVSIRDGRISTETLRARHDEHGVTSEEFAVLDTAGRLQLPEHYVESLHLRRRVRLQLESDHIVIWPEATDSDDARRRMRERRGHRQLDVQDPRPAEHAEAAAGHGDPRRSQSVETADSAEPERSVPAEPSTSDAPEPAGPEVDRAADAPAAEESVVDRAAPGTPEPAEPGLDRAAPASPEPAEPGLDRAASATPEPAEPGLDHAAPGTPEPAEPGLEAGDADDPWAPPPGWEGR